MESSGDSRPKTLRASPASYKLRAVAHFSFGQRCPFATCSKHFKYAYKSSRASSKTETKLCGFKLNPAPSVDVALVAVASEYLCSPISTNLSCSCKFFCLLCSSWSSLVQPRALQVSHLSPSREHRPPMHATQCHLTRDSSLLQRFPAHSSYPEY